MKNTTLRGPMPRKSAPAARLTAMLAIFALSVLGVGATAAPAGAARSAPPWKIEAIVYVNTDFTYADTGGGSHHLVASLTPDELTTVKDKVNTFVNTDIPSLSSGRQNPAVSIKTIDTPLSGATLIPDGYGGWTPSPWTTQDDQEPGFDSYIVLWQPYGWDFGTNSTDNIARAGGLTWNMGTAPQFSEIEVPAIGAYDRNVFKHEWGHEILFYYEAAGTAPKPTVNNHQPENYVNCRSHKPYVLQDDSDLNPIPNSIFNDSSGFTHDYYSGLTALKSSPMHCIGITRAAWASGGPVTKR